MVSFLFWNLARNPKTFVCIGRLAVTYDIDVFFLAECPPDAGSIVVELNPRGRGLYQVVDGGTSKVRGISRLPASEFFFHFNNLHGDLTIWNLAIDESGGDQIQLAVVHLPSKVGGNKPEDQQAAATEVAREIVEYEDLEGCQNTVVLGDLNMNPFEPGMVLVSGFHGAMTKGIAGSPDRIWRKEGYRRLYNPMWGLFGDRTPGPPGTHYWNSSVTSNQHWHMFDQVLLRPSLMDRLTSIQILDHDGEHRLVNEQGQPTKKYLSDHLPILFTLDV
jgi:hypothetical protein